MNDSTAVDFAQFKPRDYLDFYYTRIDEENQSLLQFFADAYKDIPTDSMMLEFGGGPTIYQIICAAKHAKAIDFCDYLEGNLDEIKLWQDGDSKSFSWDQFIKRALEIEGLPSGLSDITKREKLIKSKLRKIMPADAFRTDPCGLEYREYYDVLGLSFVPEGITNSKPVWQELMANITSLLKPGGTLANAAILEAEYWRSGSQILPAVYLTEDDFKQTFSKLGLSIQSLHSIPSEILDKSDPDYTGYGGMVFIKAVKA